MLRLNAGEVLPDDPFLLDHQKPPLQVADWFLGLDLGQLSDPSAAAMVRRTIFPRERKPPAFDVTLLRRWELGTSYTVIVKDVADLLTSPGTDGHQHFPGCRLVIDATGVGRPVVDLLREIPGMRERTVAVTITGGTGSGWNSASVSYHVAKVELVAALQALRGQGRFRIAKDVRLAKEVTAELSTFSSKVTPSGQLTYESWRSQDHDDLVLGIVLPLWYGRIAPTQSQAPHDDRPLTPGRSDPTRGEGDGWIDW